MNPQSPTYTNNQSYNQNQPSQKSSNSQQFVPPSRLYIQNQKYGSAFFLDNNEEEYVIQRAFKANNFTSLRDLPDNFSRGCVLNERKERVKDQIEDQTDKRKRTPYQIEEEKILKSSEIKKAKIGTLGYFEMFPYQESDYELPQKLATKERLQKQEKRKQINSKDFRPAGFDVKMKYEDPFRYVDRVDSATNSGTGHYIFPFHLPEDVYDSFKENEKRERIVGESLRLAGEFLPSKTQRSLHNVSKGKMPQILNEIEYYFKKYLKDKFGYFIGVSKKDHIEILFQSKYYDDPKLQMALSGMLQHEILSKFALRKNYQKWGSISEKTGYLEYVIFPPWVKQPQELVKSTQSVYSKGHCSEFSKGNSSKNGSLDR